MNRKNWSPADLSKVTTHPLSERTNKVSVQDFAVPVSPSLLIDDLLESLPKILKGQDLTDLIDSMILAYRQQKPVIAMLGGHVVKCGLSPILIDLMQIGVISALVFNGSTAIHDFEIGMIGETSEDVELNIQTGHFGMAEETGRLMNHASIQAVRDGTGLGEGFAQALWNLNPPYAEASLMVQAQKLNIPITVHVAIGTDIIHQHPTADGAAIGKASFDDFRLLTSIVADLGSGGVVLNFGSAVILPEVFLKSLTVARNLGHTVRQFTTANFDMVNHYRPQENVVRRPTSDGGQGFTFCGHHEIMIPLLAAGVKSRLVKST